MTGIKLVVLILTCWDLWPSARSQYYPGGFSNSYSPSSSASFSSGESGSSSPWTTRARYPSQTKSSFPGNPTFGQRQGYGFGRPTTFSGSSSGFGDNSGYSGSLGSSLPSSYYSQPSYSSVSNPAYSSSPSDSYSNPSFSNDLDGFSSVPTNSKPQSFSQNSGSFSSNTGVFSSTSNSGGFSSNTGGFSSNTNQGFPSTSSSGGLSSSTPDENGFYIKYPDQETGQQYFEGDTLVIKDLSDTYSSYNNQEQQDLTALPTPKPPSNVVKIIGPNGQVSETIVTPSAEDNSIPNSYLPPPEVISIPSSPSSPLLQPLDLEVPTAQTDPNLGPIASPSDNETASEGLDSPSISIDQGKEPGIETTPAKDPEGDIDVNFGQDLGESNSLNFDGEVYAFDGPSEAPQEIDNAVDENDLSITEKEPTPDLEPSNLDELTFGKPSVNSLDLNDIPVEPVRQASDTTFVTVTDEPRWIHCKSNNGKFAGMCGFGEFNVCCMSDRDLSHLVGVHHPTPSETTTRRIPVPNVPEQELPISSTSEAAPQDVSGSTSTSSTTPTGSTTDAIPITFSTASPTITTEVTTTTTVASTTASTTTTSITTPVPTTPTTPTNPAVTSSTPRSTPTTQPSSIVPTDTSTAAVFQPPVQTPSDHTFYQIPSQEYTKPFTYDYTKFMSSSTSGDSYHANHHHKYKYPTYAPHTSKIPDFGSALYSSQSTITKVKDKARPQGFDEALFSQPQSTTTTASTTTKTTTTTTSKPTRTRFKVRPFAFDTNRFESFCSLLGEVMEKPQQLSDMVRLFSGVPLITCNPVRKSSAQPSDESNSVDSGGDQDEIHVCCRDTNYFDPWP
ncbi:hypothetical protein TCAL_10372 [Tigriopus californicus]|uniref:SH3 domain-containing protein n=1 Tax=Tigriopus californicus TaxID=6832 RepID=A0A553PSD9_TIGCA|nr:hypothetical protein TCAL_10372 [Tigriopus californicus]